MRIRRILPPIFLLLFVLTGCGQVASDTVQGNHPSDEQLAAMYAKKEIATAFREECPTWYGGVYSKEDRCIVLLTDNAAENQNEIIQLSSYGHILQFEQCAFSCSYLQEIYAKVQAYQQNNSKLKNVYISVSDNCVIVQVIDIESFDSDDLIVLDVIGQGSAIRVEEFTQEYKSDT